MATHPSGYSRVKCNPEVDIDCNLSVLAYGMLGARHRPCLFFEVMQVVPLSHRR
jgi:hypothetical protein